MHERDFGLTCRTTRLFRWSSDCLSHLGSLVPRIMLPFRRIIPVVSYCLKHGVFLHSSRHYHHATPRAETCHQSLFLSIPSRSSFAHHYANVLCLRGFRLSFAGTEIFMLLRIAIDHFPCDDYTTSIAQPSSSQPSLSHLPPQQSPQPVHPDHPTHPPSAP